MWLTHWCRVTHISVSKLTNIRSDNGLSPGRRQAIIWTNAGILLIGPLGTNFSEILSEFKYFHSRKCSENVVCEIVSILSRPHCVNSRIYFTLTPLDELKTKTFKCLHLKMKLQPKMLEYASQLLCSSVEFHLTLRGIFQTTFRNAFKRTKKTDLISLKFVYKDRIENHVTDYLLNQWWWSWLTNICITMHQGVRSLCCWLANNEQNLDLLQYLTHWHRDKMADIYENC